METNQSFDFVEFLEVEENNSDFLKGVCNAFDVSKMAIGTNKDPSSVFNNLMSKVRFPGGNYATGIRNELEEMATDAYLWLRNNHPVERHIPMLKRAAKDQGYKTFEYRRHPRAPEIEEI